MNEWRRPEPPLTLSGGDIHIWRVGLAENNEALITRRAQVLALDEQARAARFRLERDRRRFVLARSALRTTLGGYLGVPSSSLRFDYGPNGKPVVGPEFPALSFNVSHSDDLALIAVRDGDPLGVDIERVRPDIGGEEIAARFFCPAERAWLNALPPEHQPAGFFCLWTRKEAYIKGLGSGLWHDLNAFDVSQSPPHPIRRSGSDDSAQPWYVQDLAPGDGYRAALAVEGACGQVFLWQMPP